MEKKDWKPFRNALDKSDRKKFDEMWDNPNSSSFKLDKQIIYAVS